MIFFFKFSEGSSHELRGPSSSQRPDISFYLGGKLNWQYPRQFRARLSFSTTKVVFCFSRRVVFRDVYRFSRRGLCPERKKKNSKFGNSLELAMKSPIYPISSVSKFLPFSFFLFSDRANKKSRMIGFWFGLISRWNRELRTRPVGPKTEDQIGLDLSNERDRLEV